MATLAWPASLPKRFLRASYNETPAENVLREQMDVGPAKTRRRATVAPVRVSGQMVMTEAQAERFDNFYRVDTVHGTVEFNMPDLFGRPRDMMIVQPPSFDPRADSLLIDVGMVLEYIP